MKFNNFITELNKNKGKELVFQYDKNQVAGTNYHLTEIKNVHFETVDCGGNINDWKETHLQLWESPNEIGKKEYMTVDKVIAIIERVNSIKPLWLEKEVKVEFGNETFHTSILDITSIKIIDNKLTVLLFTTETGCKAPDTCGVEVDEVDEVVEGNSSCCGTTTTSCC